MRLNVDLQCEKCYKKVKKVLCKFPQIRDQMYDEKNNQVIIKVVCCSPEKIRDKICYKGGGSIKSIEIPDKPKPAEPKKEAEKPKSAEPEKKKEPETKKEAEKKEEKKDTPEKKKQDEKPKTGADKPPGKTADGPKAAVAPNPVTGYPPPVNPIAMYCGPYYDGRESGQHCHGYGGPPQCYEGYYSRPVYDSYGGARPYNVSRYDDYLSEENQSGCTIM
ncbi:pollen-specific leucine-rich repeat extensin-like protein 1 isoform X1 [Quillaja saponaria]|uniref:Pollen-specific leucine-rich repeat extensin-like protein 1 isoform X1 n=1 Tax=Quillaja saponaria TaxID=32244 RepID=A0AAD7M2H2_QUISA|nr:pollen-specific leucine-rich repeat extensin-like protein 1 isoform X1 [Quillaja saponaria]